jgi:hemolysin III
VQEGTRVPLYTVGEEFAHAVTHGLGLVLSLGGLAVLVVMASLRGDTSHVVGSAVFGVTLVLLYAASTLYHGIQNPPAKAVLRRIDHSAVFLLIAGTYTPFTLVTLRGSVGWTLLALVWGLAILGVALHVAVPRRATWFSVPLALAMGWLVVIAFEPLVRSVHPDGLLLMVAGGLAYTLGVVFYGWRRLPYNHAVWHVCVLAGSACHFSCVLAYVIPSVG